MSRATLDALVALVEGHPTARLLVDETYREMTFGDALPVAASLGERAISVTSLSKTYGLPGIRVGWLLTRDRELFVRLLAAKEQILISGSLVDETIALAALRRRPTWLPEIRARIDAAFGITSRWLEGNPRFEWVPPRGGVVGFPRIRVDVAATLDVDRFYDGLFERHGTIVGPGHWFEQPRTHFRLGYGWPTLEELRGGLAALDEALDEARG
jgi:aspartate/methionine/tyrosine aminotransferase